MADNMVSRVRTPLDARETYNALRERWRSVVQSEPTRARVLVLLAHVWHETGGGTASFNYMLAGIKWTRGCGRDFFVVQTTEVINGQSTAVSAPFRAYPDLDDAASDYIALLRGQFGFAWPAVEAANPQDFAHRLRVRGYYTAPEEQYAEALVRRYSQVGALISEDTNPDAPVALQGRPVYVIPDPDEPDVA